MTEKTPALRQAEIGKVQAVATETRPTKAKTVAKSPVSRIRSPSRKTAETAPRLASKGDTSGATTPKGIGRRVAKAQLDAAQGAQQSALKDILGHTNDKASALKTLLAGSSPDDVAVIRKMLMGGQQFSDKEAVRPDEELVGDWRTGAYPYKNLMSRKRYETQKYQLQVELLKLQNWAKESGQRVVILFEGRDAAGKGGAIKRFMEHLNPRGARLVALEKPTDTERGQWYFQRYVQHLPTAGEIVMFDRSWYNRAGVERVMGFCNEHEYQVFIRQAPLFERQLVSSGVHL